MLQYSLLDLLVFGPIISAIYLTILVVGLLAFTVVSDDNNSFKEGNGWGAFVVGPVAIWVFIRFGLKPGSVDLSWLNWSTGALATLGYFFVGGFWAAYKWWSKLNRWVDAELKRAEKHKQYPDAFQYREEATDPEYMPTPTRYKAQIVFWASYWLPNAIGSLVPNFYTHVRDAVYATFGGIYNRITAKQRERYVARLTEMGVLKTVGKV